MTTLRPLRLLLPKSLASAGWDIVKKRGDVEGVNRRSNLTPHRRPILTPLSGGF